MGKNDHPSNFKVKRNKPAPAAPLVEPPGPVGEAPSCVGGSSRRVRIEAARGGDVWIETKADTFTTDGAVMVSPKALADALRRALGWGININGALSGVRDAPEAEPEVKSGFKVEIEAHDGMTTETVTGAESFYTSEGELHVLGTDARKLYVGARGAWRSAAKVAA